MLDTGRRVGSTHSTLLHPRPPLRLIGSHEGPILCARSCTSLRKTTGLPSPQQVRCYGSTTRVSCWLVHAPSHHRTHPHVSAVIQPKRSTLLYKHAHHLQVDDARSPPLARAHPRVATPSHARGRHQPASATCQVTGRPCKPQPLVKPIMKLIIRGRRSQTPVPSW